MKILIVYESKTGFTKRYAEWIADELQCEAKPLKNVTQKEISESDMVIHGGWIMGSMINGLEKVRQMSPKQLVIFGVGCSKKGECEQGIIDTNHLAEIPFFYMEGGYHPKKMGFLPKLMVKLVTKQPVTETDHSDRSYIKPLVTYAMSCQ